MVGAYTSTDKPRPEQLTDAILVLNMMLKLMSIEAPSWLRQFVTITLVAGQGSYTLGPNGTPAIDRPTHVFNLNKKTAQGNEIPMVSLTRSDWMNLPNKTNSSGVPVQFYYDPQTIDGVLHVWPVPSVGTTDVLIADVDRQLDLMLDNLNDFDLPPQWLEPLAYMLAVRLAPEYGLPISERAKLAEEASNLYSRVITNDMDIASIYMGVRR
jgi:hypothetical protein